MLFPVLLTNQRYTHAMLFTKKATKAPYIIDFVKLCFHFFESSLTALASSRFCFVFGIVNISSIDFNSNLHFSHSKRCSSTICLLSLLHTPSWYNGNKSLIISHDTFSSQPPVIVFLPYKKSTLHLERPQSAFLYITAVPTGAIHSVFLRLPVPSYIQTFLTSSYHAVFIIAV